MKICLKNSECAKQQKNSHTTGRKGHARLLKEMETERNGEVSKIELWDRAHKRKEDNDSNNVNTIMDTTHDELCKRKLDDKESLSPRDDSEVSKTLLAKRTKLRGFYHDKFWNHVKVSQGMTFLEESHGEFKLRTIGDNVENMMDEFQMMRAFLAKKFPGEDYRDVMEAAENSEVDLHGRANDTNTQHEISNDIHESPHNMHTSSNTLQKLPPGKGTRIKEGCVNSSLPHEDVITKEAHVKIYAKENQGCVSREQVTKQQPRLDNYSKESYANSSLGRRRIIAMKANNENSTEADQGCDISSFSHNQPSSKDKFEVFLFSANPRNKNKVVAIGSLITQDKTYVVGGNMLGDEYCAVLVNIPTPIADEKLPRPYEDIQTVRDALGHVIAWPRFYIKKKKLSSNQPNSNLVKSGAK
nr:uncharacterized protein LOC127302427 isoform X2 [Lolium perenne]